MKFRFFSWTLQKEHPQPHYTEADRLASFIVMAYPEYVNLILYPYHVTVYFSDADYACFLNNGKVPQHVADIASRYRPVIIRNMHRLLQAGDNFNRVIGRVTHHPDEELLQKLSDITSDWPVTGCGMPYHVLYDYVPVHVTDNHLIEQTDDIMQVRQLVWNFKYSNESVTPQQHNKALCMVAESIAGHINTHFSGLTHNLTLFCVPAASRDKSLLRYGEFSHYLCKLTGMQNSFQYVRFTTDRTPAHLGGERIYNYVLEAKWFSGRTVILFDDIVTTGTSAAQTADLLDKTGAHVIAAYFIGQTVKIDI